MEQFLENILIGIRQWVNNSKGYVYDESNGSFTTKYKQDAAGGGQIVANTATGLGSVAEGYLTIAQNQGEHAEGSSNVSHKASDVAGNAGNTQHSVGIAFGDNTGTIRKNAFEIMQNGDVYVLGVGGYQGTNTKVQEASIKTLQEYIASLEARINALEGNATV